MECIVACECSGVLEKAEKTFQIIFGMERKLPQSYKGDSQVRKLAEQHQDTNVGRNLMAIAKTNGQWAYYIKADYGGRIEEQYNLLNGKRVA